MLIPVHSQNPPKLQNGAQYLSRTYRIIHRLSFLRLVACN